MNSIVKLSALFALCAPLFALSGCVATAADDESAIDEDSTAADQATTGTAEDAIWAARGARVGGVGYGRAGGVAVGRAGYGAAYGYRSTFAGGTGLYW